MHIIGFRIELDWTGNSKSKLEMNWFQLKFYCLDILGIFCWNQRVVANSNSCLDVQTVGLDGLLSLERGHEELDLESARERPPPAAVALWSAFPYHPVTSRVN
jgi:hypothetical protein